MNEILAIIVFAYFSERLHVEQDLDYLSTDEIIADPDLFSQYVFDSRHTFADIYSTMSRILSFGIKNLYQETKDISELRKELVIAWSLIISLQFKEQPKNLDGHELFVWKQRQEIEEKKIRIKLEKAYEQEKSKVIILYH